MIKRKRTLLVLIFNVIIVFCSFSQSSSFAYAEHLYEHKQYDAALKEYLRSYYFDTEANASYTKIIELFQANGDSDNALKYLDLYYYQNYENQSVKNDILFEKAKIYLSKKESQQAILSLSQMDTKYITDMDSYQFWNALAQFQVGDLDNGRNCLLKLSYIDENNITQIDKSLEELKKLKLKNPNKAIWYSVLVPGLGQTIYGNPKDGLTSFGLVTGLIIVFIEVSASLSFQQALISTSPWLIRYYAGGLRNTVLQAKKFNQNKEYKLVRSVITEVQKLKFHTL
ncbi:MAG TPA: hypothetical protein PKD51_16245 [Saprospiraceae bacterium]|nr:hypothetical protein [Saprospiraceae bacterium]HMU02378.1 hypothetical protein [Saprospiraceae bacterium]